MSESNGRSFISKEKALELIGKKETVHTFVNPGPSMLIGTDMTWEQIVALLAKAESIEIAGNKAKEMGHPIAALVGQMFYFIEATIPEAT